MPTQVSKKSKRPHDSPSKKRYHAAQRWITNKAKKIAAHARHLEKAKIRRELKASA